MTPSTRDVGTAAEARPVVCFLVERLTIGGAEVLVQRLAAAMRTGRYQPLVCCLEGGPLVKRIQEDGVPLVCLDLPRPSVLTGPWFALHFVRLAARLMRVVRQHRVAIIHAHLADAAVLGAFIGAMCRTPVVATYHGLGILPSDRGAYDPRNRVRRWLYRTSGRLSARTIAVAPAVLDLLRKELGIDDTRAALILNGVDPVAPANPAAVAALRSELRITGNAKVIACVGRLATVKGQRFLIEAMPAVLERHPAAVLLLVGGGSSLTDLQALAAARGVSPQIRFAGERSDVSICLSLADVFALASLQEGIPVALIEAMAAARPAVATAVPGSVDVIDDPAIGILVPPQDPRALADAIGRVLDDPAAARAMGLRAQQSIARRFSMTAMVAQTERLYDDVLREGR
jgi:glycosyltransferase involved in cell wall biosynthesis